MINLVMPLILYSPPSLGNTGNLSLLVNFVDERFLRHTLNRQEFSGYEAYLMSLTCRIVVVLLKK